MPWYTHEDLFGVKPMHIDELACLVRNMRKAQQTYFKTRSTNDLGIARDWERHVDAVLVKLNEGPDLFDLEEPGSG